LCASFNSILGVYEPYRDKKVVGVFIAFSCAASFVFS
jgi:hypothetical protein